MNKKLIKMCIFKKYFPNFNHNLSTVNVSRETFTKIFQKIKFKIYKIINLICF